MTPRGLEGIEHAEVIFMSSLMINQLGAEGHGGQLHMNLGPNGGQVIFESSQRTLDRAKSVLHDQGFSPTSA